MSHGHGHSHDHNHNDGKERPEDTPVYPPPNATGYPFPQKPPPVPATKRPTEDRKTAELRAAMSYALGEEPTA
jgi:hypothetical protein